MEKSSYDCATLLHYRSTTMSLSQLIAQREALDRQQAELAKAIAEAQMSVRREVINQIKQLMAEHGLGHF